MKNAFLALAVLLSQICFAVQTYRYVRVPLSVLNENGMRDSGFIRDHFVDDTYAIGYLPKEGFPPLPVKALSKMIELDPVAWAHTDYDLKTLKPLPILLVADMGPFEDFHNYETLTTELKALAQKFPQLVSLYSAGKTVEGRELWYLRLSSKNSNIQAKPKLLFVSSMHGDEVTGKEMMVYLIRDFLSRYGTDARATQLMDSADLFIMPSMNPDGTERSQRFNANGVDLNRDFPEFNEDPFGGNRAIETRNLMELHRQNHFEVALNFHGGSLCVNLPWDSKSNGTQNLFGDNSLVLAMGHEYADANKPMHNNHSGNFNHGVTYGYEWYPIYGGMQDWASYFQQSTHATIEISSTKWPSAESLPRYWAENREALTHFLENGIYGIHLKVTNSAGELLDASVDISSAKRTLKYAGYVHRPTVKGSQSVTISAAGYQSQTLNLMPAPFNGNYQNITLNR